MSTHWVRCFVPFLLASLGLPTIRAQRIYERGLELMLEDAQGRRSLLGPGFNPIPISDGRFLLIRGARMGYGEQASCERAAAKNRVVLYDTATNHESLLFDKPLAERRVGHDAACVYETADLSPSGSILYIVTPCYVTAGCLAVVDLPTGWVRYVEGAMDVYVIRGGLRGGDLVFMRRLNRKPTRDDPRLDDYAYVHARPDGSQIAIISNEDLVQVGRNAPAPILRAWLRSEHGRIFVQGEWIP
jgi:hypothetical protein